MGGTVLFQLSLLEKLLCYKLLKSIFLGGPVLKIAARLLLILTIASGSLLACGGSEDAPATPTSLAEKIAQTIEKNGYTTVECSEIDMDPPGYLDGTNDESGICGDFIIVTYDPETEWQEDGAKFIDAQGSLACSEGWADYILVAAGFNKNFVIYGEVELNNGTEDTLLQEFEKIAKELDPWAASYVDCNSPDTYETGVYLFQK